MPVVSEFRVAGLQETLNAFRQIHQEYQRLGQITEQSIRAMREQSTSIRAVRQSFALVRAEWRISNYELLEMCRVFNRLSTIGRTIMNMWQAYTVAQIRVERLTRDVADAEQELAKWTDLAAQYLRDFGEDSSYYLDAIEEVDTWTRRVQESHEALTQAQQENVMGYISMGMQMGTFVSQAVYVKQHLELMSGSAISLSSVLSGTLPIAFGVLGGVIAASLLDWERLAQYWQSTVGVGLVELEQHWIELQEQLGITGESMTTLKDVWNTALSAMTAPVRVVIDYIDDAREAVDLWTQAITELIRWWKQLTTLPSAPFPELPWFNPPPTEQIGGIIPFTALYRLHAGEVVIPEHRTHEIREVRTIGPPQIREVNIRQNFYGDITSELDLRRAGESGYREFEKKLEKIA